MSARLAGAGARLREFFAGQAELHERRQLLLRPWEEQLLHWGAEGELHGDLCPPRGRRRSTTAQGWCSCRVPARS